MAVHVGGRGPGHLSRVQSGGVVAQLVRSLQNSPKSGLWLPAGESGLWSDTGKTMPVVAGSGDPVAVCDDLTGNGNDLIRGSGTHRPVATEGLTLDGAEDYMGYALPGGAGSGSMCIVALMKTTDTQFMVASSSDASARFEGRARNSGSASIGSVDIDVDGVTVPVATATAPDLQSAIADGTWKVVTISGFTAAGWTGIDFGWYANAGVGGWDYAGAFGALAVLDLNDFSAGSGAALEAQTKALFASIGASL